MVKLLAVEGAGEQNLIYDECQKRNHMTNYVTAQFQSHLHVEGFFFFFSSMCLRSNLSRLPHNCLIY